MSRKFAVIEIGGTKLQFALGDGTGVIAKRLRFHVDKARGAEGIRARIAEVLPPLVGEHDAAGVAAGFGGPVDWRSGRIARSHQIEGWSDFELGPWLEQIAGVPAVVDNDANVAALGEAWRGAGAGMNPVFYVTLGSGVGGGLVADGQDLRQLSPGTQALPREQQRAHRHGIFAQRGQPHGRAAVEDLHHEARQRRRHCDAQ